MCVCVFVRVCVGGGGGCCLELLRHAEDELMMDRCFYTCFDELHSKFVMCLAVAICKTCLILNALHCEKLTN